MKRAARMKRDMYIYKLAKEGASYKDIQGLLVLKYGEGASLYEDHIGKIVRKMRKLFEAAESEPDFIDVGDEEHNFVIKVPKKQTKVESEIY